LLLEIGLLHQACDHYEECLEVCRSPGRQRPTRERAAGLIPHPQMGGLLAFELSLPESIEYAIAEHHAVVKPNQPLAAVCWVAEICSAVFEVGDEARNLAVAEAAAQQLGVHPDELAVIFESTQSEVDELALALECAGGPYSQRGLHRPIERDLAEMQLQYEQLIQVLTRVMDQRDSLQLEVDEACLALTQAATQSAIKA
jgi:hypothetical protein